MARDLERLRERTRGYTVTPRQYARVAYIALAALTLIVLSGAAVRLTGSGLGCPHRPRVSSVPARDTLGALSILACTCTAAASPHACASPGQRINRRSS